MTNTGKNLEQLKTTTKRRMWRNWKRQQRKNVEKLEPSYITCRDVKWYSNNREQSGHPSKTLTIELPYDPTILLLYVYAGEMKTYVRNLYLMVVETWKPKIKLLTVLVSGESLLPALQAATFWMYPQMNERVSSNVFLCKGTNPTMGAPPSWPNLNLITSRHHTVGLGLQYINSERRGHKDSDHNMVYPYDGSFSQQKEWISHICGNGDGPWKHYVKWKLAVQKDHIVWFHLYEIPRIANL